MTNLDESALLEWLAGLFPLRATPGRPLTVMFTDLEGFTTAAASRGDGTALRLLRGHDAAVLPQLRRHTGRLLKRLGDGLMAVFGSPAAAVAAAIAMQEAAIRRPGVRLRIGIHTGAARTRAGDLVGHAVNVASRIADRAPGGAILVSDAVRAGAEGVPARFNPRRPLVVAGRSVALFRVRR
jgi:adenylate cyclase